MNKITKRSLKYFAYGSNMHPLRLLQRVPSSKALAKAELHSHMLRFHKRGADGSGKCNVFHTGESRDKVIGVVYEMDAAEQPLLDLAEGLGRGYDLAEHTVIADDGEHEVFFYIAHQDYIDDELRPYTWYKELVLHGARLHDLPDVYIEELEMIEALMDPDKVREELHQRILAAKIAGEI